jgi:hypothetical protein
MYKFDKNPVSQASSILGFRHIIMESQKQKSHINLLTFDPD